MQLVQNEEIKKLVESMVAEAVARFVYENELKAKELSLMERTIRVEEELKALRELQYKQFELTEKRFETLQREMNKRFEALQREMDARFEAIEKRFEALQQQMDARFEAIEKRFEALQREMDKRFEALQREMNARFEAMNTRFEAMDARFQAMEKRMQFMQWFMGLGFTVIVVLMTLFKFIH